MYPYSLHVIPTAFTFLHCCDTLVNHFTQIQQYSQSSSTGITYQPVSHTRRGMTRAAQSIVDNSGRLKREFSPHLCCGWPCMICLTYKELPFTGKLEPWCGFEKEVVNICKPIDWKNHQILLECKFKRWPAECISQYISSGCLPHKHQVVKWQKPCGAEN